MPRTKADSGNDIATWYTALVGSNVAPMPKTEIMARCHEHQMYTHNVIIRCVSTDRSTGNIGSACYSIYVSKSRTSTIANLYLHKTPALIASIKLGRAEPAI